MWPFRPFPLRPFSVSNPPCRSGLEWGENEKYFFFSSTVILPDELLDVSEINLALQAFFKRLVLALFPIKGSIGK